MRRGKKKIHRTPAIEEDTSNLPFEVVYTILSKLPVKSLMRFKCVCKPWRALISEPQFIKSHLSEAIKSDRRRVICSGFYSLSFYSVDYESSDRSEEELYFPIKKYRKAKVLSSCNGIVLLGLNLDKMYVLWNPSTKAYLKFSCPYHVYLFDTVSGICYDSSIDDYKVVFIPDGGGPSKFMVFTCKTNSWIENKELPSMTFPGISGVNVSGAPHWVVTLKKDQNLEFVRPTNESSENSLSDCDEAVPSYEHDPNETYAIVCFDSVEEKFKEVPLPKWICDGHLFVLKVMRECLSLCMNSSDKQHVDVWVMKEYGNRNSWTKLINISCNKIETSYWDPLRPMCCTKKGEVVLMNKSRIVLYDPEENKSRNLTSSACHGHFFMVHTYVDSLVLPIYDKLLKRQQHKPKEKGKRKEL